VSFDVFIVVKPFRTRFKRWRALAKARYVKAMYKSAVDAKNAADFLAKVGSAEAILQDPTAWDNYKSCRGIDEYRIGILSMLEANKIKKKIANFEHDLWNF